MFASAEDMNSHWGDVFYANTGFVIKCEETALHRSVNMNTASTAAQENLWRSKVIFHKMFFLHFFLVGLALADRISEPFFC